jgi:ArsR family transcriptional regulator
VEDLAKVVEALGDPLRMRIMDLLASGRLDACCSPTNPDFPGAVCACDLASDLGGVAPSKLAYHLARLRAAGLVHEQRRGKWVYYSINCVTLAALCQQILDRWTVESFRTARIAQEPVPGPPGSMCTSLHSSPSEAGGRALESRTRRIRR